MAKRTRVFSERFLDTLRSLVVQHHTIYPSLPPSGIYFESLVERAYRLIRQPFTVVQPSNPNSPKHDLLVQKSRISIKTETGAGTKRAQINITKLCTTERDPWEAESLRRHALSHLSRYDCMLMMRAIWEGDIIHYQVLDIPIELLMRIRDADLREVGKRKTRKSIGGDVILEGRRLFHVHFDGSDGKCQIQRLDVDLCHRLREWDYQIQ